MKTEKLTLTEALKLLEVYNTADELAITDTADTNSCYTHDYDDYINSTADSIKAKMADSAKLGTVSTLLHDKLSEDVNKTPAIGDIAVLKIKLAKTKEDKFIYNGYERRPILIIKAHENNLVDGIEITHSTTFKQFKLINIGKLGADTQDSYANIYSQYSNLSTSYEFPIEFKDGKPITKGEYSLQYFGKIYRGKDIDEPLLVEFDYNSNYKEKIDVDTLVMILAKLKSVNK